MSEHQADCQKIIEFIYRCDDLPEDLRSRLAQWLLTHKDDPELEISMVRIWNECVATDSESFDSCGLQRLLSEVAPAHQPSRKHRIMQRVLRYAAAAAIILSAVAGAFTLGRQTAVPDTVLLAAAGSKGEFMLPDSSRVWLNGGSSLRYNASEFTADSRSVSITGEAYLEVTKDPSRPFTVKMPEMEVEVLGTSFDVRDYSFSPSKEVVLSEGSIKVSGRHIDRPLIMKPDQRLVVDRNSGKVTLSQARARNYCSWHQQSLRFEGETLGDILVQLGRRYSLDLEVTPDVDISMHLSLTIYNDDIHEIMKIISYLSSTRYTIQNNTLKVSI